LHVLEIYAQAAYANTATGYYAPEMSTEYVQEHKGQAEQQMETFVKHLPEDVQGMIARTIVEHGLLAENAHGLEKIEGISHIFLTGHESEDFLDRLFFNNYRNVIENCKSPVWIIDPGVVFRPFKKIVYATDYHPEDLTALQQLLKLARIFNARVDILHIGNEKAADKKINGTTFQQALKTLGGNQHFNFKRLESGGVSSAIVRYAEEQQADLLVMLKENKGFFEQLFSSSSTEKVRRKSRLPLMIFNSEALSDKDE